MNIRNFLGWTCAGLIFLLAIVILFSKGIRIERTLPHQSILLGPTVHTVEIPRFHGKPIRLKIISEERRIQIDACK